MMLIAFPHALDEIIKLAAFPLRFLDNDLPGRQVHDIQLEPLATSSKLDTQAIFAGDHPKFFWQVYHGFSLLQLPCTAGIGACFVSFQRHVHDLLSGVRRMVLHKVFLPSHLEVSRNINYSMFTIDGKTQLPFSLFTYCSAIHLETWKAKSIVHLESDGWTRWVWEHPPVIGIVTVGIVGQTTPTFSTSSTAHVFCILTNARVSIDMQRMGWSRRVDPNVATGLDEQPSICYTGLHKIESRIAIKILIDVPFRCSCMVFEAEQFFRNPRSANPYRIPWRRRPDADLARRVDSHRLR